MNKLFLLVVLVTSMAKAQSFDFSCEQLLTGQITVETTVGFFRIEDPRGNRLDVLDGKTFDLTIAGDYLITRILFNNETKIYNITENGNQSLLWSEL